MIKLFFSKIYFLLLVITSLLLVGACTSAEAKPSANRPPLKVAWSPWPGYYPMVIASEKGLFAKHGVAVEPVFYNIYTSQSPDFQTGKLDGVLLVLTDALILDAKSPDKAHVVTVVDNSDGADVVVALPEITTVADLRGKQIGATLSSFGELLIRRMLETNGLEPDEVTLVNMNPEDVPKSMPNLIQAGATYAPFTAEATAKGYRVLYTSAETPGLISDVLLFTTSVIKERPDDVRAFIAAWFEAVAYWQANQAEANALIAKATGLKPEEISAEGVKILNLEDNLQAFTPGSDTTSLYFSAQISVDFLISSGILNNAPDPKRLLDPSFLK
jgi:NitT/TauT family transport system substrate-binding protein